LVDKYLYNGNFDPKIGDVGNNAYIVQNISSNIDLYTYTFSVNLLSVVYVGGTGSTDDNQCGGLSKPCASIRYSLLERLNIGEGDNLKVFLFV
jgi:hypothetical protein